MNDSRPLHLLRDALKAVAPYPRGVLAVPEPIKGTAFFPGGDGLWKEDGPIEFPIGGIMVLGHDFHSEEGFRRSLELGHERMTDPTWRNLLALLSQAGISPAECFFTNFYMGLREGKETTGVFPGSRDKDFVARCRSFFLQQLEVQQPEVILTLGGQVPRLIAPLAPQLSEWMGTKGLKVLDMRSVAVVRDVRFTPALSPIRMAAITHPSLRHANVGRRKYKDAAGPRAELLMIREVLGK